MDRKHVPANPQLALPSRQLQLNAYEERDVYSTRYAAPKSATQSLFCNKPAIFLWFLPHLFRLTVRDFLVLHSQLSI